MSAAPTNVALIGYRGSGKTTVAQRLAQELRWSWIDADHYLEEQAGKSIRSIFNTEGEAGFRDRETATLRVLSAQRQCVVATGGGVVLRPENRILLRHMGLVVWLTCAPETLWLRLEQDATTTERRPSLTVGGLAEVRELLAAREPLYRACADLVVDTTRQPPEDVARFLCAHLAKS